MPQKQGEAFSLLLSPFQLFALFATAVTIAIAASAAFGLRASETVLRNEAEERNHAIAAMAAHSIQGHFDEMLGDVNAALASQAHIAEGITQRDFSAVQTALDTMRKNHPHLDRLAITDPAGSVWADSPVAPALRGRNFASRDWYRLVQAAQRPVLSPIDRRLAPPQVPVTVIASPIRAPGGRLVAYLVAQENLVNLGQWLSGLHPSPGTHILLYDSRGREVSDPEGRGPPESWQKPLQQAKQGRSGHAMISDTQGRRGLLSYAGVPGYGWSVLVNQPHAEVLAAAETLRTRFIGFGLLILAALLPFCYLGARALSRHQTAREQAQHLLSGVIEGSPDPIWAVDRSWQVLAYNRAAADEFRWLFGNELQLGGNVVEAMASRPDDRDCLQQRWQRVLDGESFVVTERFGHDEHDQRTFETRYYPLWGGREQPIAAAQVARDITERAQTELRIKELNLQLVQHNADLLAVNQELEHFSYSVSHDLRAPLRAIDGFAAMLAARAKERLDEEDRRLLAVVRDNSRTMGQLIDDLLDISRVSRTELRHNRVNMNLLVREVWQEVGANFRGEFDLNILPAPPADHLLMRQLWRNLLSNAVKFSIGQPEPRIEVSGEATDKECVYHVVDNGAGFDMRYASKLFGVFQRLHHAEEFPGTGIGLAIAARIVTRHGGRIWAEGMPGQGARFHFTLPCVAPEGDRQHE
jgi:PAS domain S-box-containing protein